MDFRSMALHVHACIGRPAGAGRALPRGARRVLCRAAGWPRPWLCSCLFKGQLTGEGSGTLEALRRRAHRQCSARRRKGSSRSPFIGQGSWFEQIERAMENRFVEIRAENARAAGVGGFGDDDGDTMAIHSQVLVGLAEGGLLGGCFFIAYGVFLVLGRCATWRIDAAVGAVDERSFLFVLLSGLAERALHPVLGGGAGGHRGDSGGGPLPRAGTQAAPRNARD